MKKIEDVEEHPDNGGEPCVNLLTMAADVCWKFNLKGILGDCRGNSKGLIALLVFSGITLVNTKLQLPLLIASNNTYI